MKVLLAGIAVFAVTLAWLVFGVVRGADPSKAGLPTAGPVEASGEEVEFVSARVLFERDKDGKGLDPRPERKVGRREATALASYFPGIRGPRKVVNRVGPEWKSLVTIIFEEKGGKIRAVHVSPDCSQWWWRDPEALGVRRAKEGLADDLDRLKARAKDAK